MAFGVSIFARVGGWISRQLAGEHREFRLQARLLSELPIVRSLD